MDVTNEEQKGSEEKEPKERTERKRLSNNRRFPILLRIIVVLILAAAMLAIGAIIGYSVIGGGEWRDVFDIDTWRHITDFWLTS
ncbi:DNA-directed RNA polymerase subunit beta [Exiguobacterium sp. SH1S21]|uniref:DNA-directed RNA polymerase subunit beta n=1 Tax=Exiguobacterium sp. SH1S21 TaxID=2510953 RepID=UPI00103E8B13|nr:DNA-directed RNA polymerase subunit beta [Exiguobacterium sp. SH1S21]TCI57548.1 DNA-directed RNA polymerase subunit beta [Exiguobacterium sp. SH1S21]